MFHIIGSRTQTDCYWIGISADAVASSTGPFAKLRVPKYQKAFEVLFFVSFLLFYYLVFAYRDSDRMSWAEPVLLVWIIAFACQSAFMESMRSFGKLTR